MVWFDAEISARQRIDGDDSRIDLALHSIRKCAGVTRNIQDVRIGIQRRPMVVRLPDRRDKVITESGLNGQARTEFETVFDKTGVGAPLVVIGVNCR